MALKKSDKLLRDLDWVMKDLEAVEGLNKEITALKAEVRRLSSYSPDAKKRLQVQVQQLEIENADLQTAFDDLQEEHQTVFTDILKLQDDNARLRKLLEENGVDYK